MTFTYNRLGLAETVQDGAGTRTFAYDDGGQITTETFNPPQGGLFPDLRITRDYEPDEQGYVPGRFIGFQVGTPNDPDANYAATYGYDATGLMNHVTGPGLPTAGSVHGAYYTYLTYSDLLADLEFKNDNTVLAKAARTYEDNRDLLTGIENYWRPNGSNDLISSYAYVNDELAQRTSVVNSGVAFGGTGNEHLSIWSYNDRNELTGSARYADDDPEDPENPVDAEQFTYTYDPIGNRTEYDVGVQDPSDTDYEANQLNQYLRAVTDDPNVAQGYRHDEDGNLIEAFVAADMNCDGTIDSFDVSPFVLAMTNPTLYEQTYPNCNILNGDLNGDGAVDSFDLDLFTALLLGSGGAGGLRVEYTWNAENRLTAVTPVSPQVDDIKAEFAYDYMGRRIEKKVYDWDNRAGDWEATPSLHRKFVWAGWLMLMELDGTDNAVRKLTWGLDLAGQSGGQTSGLSALESAAGIGGLLAVDQAAIDYPAPKPDIPAGEYVFFYDANGNVGQLVAWASGFGGATGDEWHADRLVAHYEYDPYGGVVNQTGAYAEENPFRFSTKYWDDETGLGYWGYRYYSPRLGRWLNRDPVGEGPYWNLYKYASNQPSSAVDLIGLYGISVAECQAMWQPIMNGFSNLRKSRDTVQQWLNYDLDRLGDALEQYEEGKISGQELNEILNEVVELRQVNRDKKAQIVGVLDSMLPSAALANWMVREGCKCAALRHLVITYKHKDALLDAINKIPPDPTNIVDVINWVNNQASGSKIKNLDLALDYQFWNVIYNDCCADHGLRQTRDPFGLYKRNPTVDTLGRENKDDLYQVCGE